MRVKEGNIRTDKQKGGGPLFDIGIYCINATRSFFNGIARTSFLPLPIKVSISVQKMDEMLSVVMKFSGGRMATFIASFSGFHQASYDVIGTTGCLRLENAYEYLDDMELHFSKVRSTTRKYKFKKATSSGQRLCTSLIAF